MSSVYLAKIFSKSRNAWIAIFSFIAFILLCFVAGIGKVLIILFPLGSIALGLFLYLHYPHLYVGFTLWMWFITPLIRRIIDYQSGFKTPGPSALVSFLVTAITFITLFKELPKQYIKTFPIFLCSGAVFYGSVVGLIQNSLDKTVIHTLWWLCPISFGFYLLVNWRNYPQFRRVILQAFFAGTIAMGLYGVWQFCTAPSWDAFWLNSIEASSFGKPFPFEIRVFSTMNAPQDFAKVISTGLLCLFIQKNSSVKYLAMIVGYLALLLTQARAAWLGWITGLLILIIFSKLKTQIRVVLGIIIALIILVPIISALPWSETITSRLDTLFNLESDESLNARLQGYNYLLFSALSQVTGKGLGYIVESSGIGPNDGSIMPAFFTLGWLGVLTYFIGFLMLLSKLFNNHTKDSHSLKYLYGAITASIFIQIGFNFIFVGVNGILLWTFICLSIAEKKYYLHQKSRRNLSKL